MMDGDSLLLLGDFNAYANQQVLAVAAQLSADQFVEGASPSHGTVRKLLIHMLGGERYFLAACQGSEFTPKEFASLSTVDEICEYWQRLAREVHAFIAGLDDADVARDHTIALGPQEYHFPMWQWFAGSFAHSAQHRGELSIVLAQLGHPLPDIDMLVYLIEQTGQPPL
jgi:uncharacterized damage-inducible protein DinB